MIQHFIKIAFRNLWKYKNQTLISILGLGVGFACFALATLWIRYEMTYDDFHKNAGQKYLVYRSTSSQAGSSSFTPLALGTYLKETFPEIVNAAWLTPNLGGNTVTVNGMVSPALLIRTDSSFFRIFNVKILEGSPEFLLPDSRKVAVTRKKARQLFGKEQPIGKTVQIGANEYTISAVVSGMSKQSNYPFDFIQPFRSDSWNPRSSWLLIDAINTIIELLPGTDIAAFEKKL